MSIAHRQRRPWTSLRGTRLRAPDSWSPCSKLRPASKVTAGSGWCRRPAALTTPISTMLPVVAMEDSQTILFPRKTPTSTIEHPSPSSTPWGSGSIGLRAHPHPRDQSQDRARWPAAGCGVESRRYSDGHERRLIHSTTGCGPTGGVGTTAPGRFSGIQRRGAASATSTRESRFSVTARQSARARGWRSPPGAGVIMGFTVRVLAAEAALADLKAFRILGAQAGARCTRAHESRRGPERLREVLSA